MPKSRLNAAALMQVKDEILNNPGSFSMNDERFSIERKIFVNAGFDPNDPRDAQGHLIDEYSTALKILRITWKQGNELFCGNWPPEIRRKYDWDETRNTQIRNAKVAAEAIDWFIKTYGFRREQPVRYQPKGLEFRTHKTVRKYA